MLPESTPVGLIEDPLPLRVIFEAFEVTVPEEVITDTVYDPGEVTTREAVFALGRGVPFLNHW
jgi:hypothetical protein